jgi:chemotaxis protein histidine kinase CheA
MAGLPRSTNPDEALRLLRERFRAASPATLARLRTLAASLASAPNAAASLDALRRELHRLNGTAGSYGFKRASQLAAGMEQQVLRWGRDPSLELDDRVEILGQFIEGLAGAFEEG